MAKASQSPTEIAKANAALTEATQKAEAWKIGGEYQRNVDIATNVITTALAGGTPAEMLASGASPIINNQIKQHTKDGSLENVMAHVIWGGIKAAAAKGNITAVAVAAASEELAAPMIAEQLYGTRDVSKLDETQKRTVVQLSSTVAGVASGVVDSKGNSASIAQSVGKGMEIGESAVEHNALLTKHVENELKTERDKALYNKLKENGIEYVEPYQEAYLNAKTGEERDKVIAEYRAAVERNNQKLLMLYQNGTLSDDDYLDLFSSFANTMQKGMQNADLSTSDSENNSLFQLSPNTENGLNWTASRTLSDPSLIEMRREYLERQVKSGKITAEERDDQLQRFVLLGEAANSNLPTGRDLYNGVKKSVADRDLNALATTAAGVGVGKAINIKQVSIYNPKQARTDTEQIHGKENVKSTTVVEKARSTNTSRVLSTGETVSVIGSGNNKAVVIRSAPDKDGNSKVIANIPYDQRGLPIFDDVAKFTTKIEKPANYQNMSSEARRRAEMRNATLALKAEIENGNINSGMFTKEQLKDIQLGNPKIEGFTWHHNAQSAPNNMQLVPDFIHKNVQHIGEASLSKGK